MLRMSTLGRNRRSGNWTARKVIPAVFRPAYAAAFGRSWEEKFAQPATLSEREARIAFADWLATIEARIALVSAQVNGEGVDLSHAQAHALAGRWYRWKTARHEDDPGSAQRWNDEIRALDGGVLGLMPEKEAVRIRSSRPMALPKSERFDDLLDRLSGADTRVLDQISIATWAPEFLAHERIILSPSGRRRFLCAVLYELVAVNALLTRRSSGDYSPDPRPERFPAWRPPVVFPGFGREPIPG
mgnify:CR=1 FL=1